MNLILIFIEEGKTIIKKLDQKQKEKMKHKIQYSKFSSSEKTELSKINTSSNKQEVAENIPVPPIGSNEFLQEEVASSSNKTELVPATGRINNTNPIILNNNTKNNRKEEASSVLSVWNSITTILKAELSEVSFNTWIGSLSALRIKNNVLIINAPSVFVKDIIESRYREIINKSIKSANNSIKDFIIGILGVNNE